MTHNHWTIHAFVAKRALPDGGFGMDDLSEIMVNADTEEEALAKAKGLLKRKYYRVAKVWECRQDHDLQQEMQMTSLEQQAALIKMMKRGS